MIDRWVKNNIWSSVADVWLYDVVKHFGLNMFFEVYFLAEGIHFLPQHIQQLLVFIDLSSLLLLAAFECLFQLKDVLV